MITNVLPGFLWLAVYKLYVLLTHVIIFMQKVYNALLDKQKWR